MNRQEYYRMRYRTLEPAWRDSLLIYRDLVAARVNAETALLDIGCGHADFLLDSYKQAGQAVGIDPDRAALHDNTSLAQVATGVADALPFADACFDVVVAAWVLEHLDDPARVFAEIRRVLKPGGCFIFLTPNAWNYNVWLIRLVPNGLHGFLVRLLYGRQETDTYPVRYRANSVATFARFLLSSGYQVEQLVFNGDPSYISFNNLLFWAACRIEKLLDLPPLRHTKVHLIGVYRTFWSL